MVLYISCDIQMKQVLTFSPSLKALAQDQTCEQGGPFSDNKGGDGQGTLAYIRPLLTNSQSVD